MADASREQAGAAAAPATKWLALLLVLLAGVWFCLANWLPWARLWYPFELEWLGGLVSDHVARILDGKPIYVAPSADFVPLLYTPLYMYLSAGMSWLTGEGLLALRLVSILAACIVQVLLFTLVRAETRSRIAAVLACGVWSGSYFVVDTWWDAERVDTAFLAFALGGFCLLRRGRGLGSAALAAGVMVLAYLTKQTALPIAGAFAVASLVTAPRRGAVFAVVFGVLWGGAVIACDAATDGWFSFYTWALPNDHEYDFTRIGTYFVADVVPMAPTLALAGWFFLRSGTRTARRAALGEIAWWGGLVGAAFLSRCHLGGAVNALMPAWLAGAIVVGLMWHAVDEREGGRRRIAVAILLLLQFALFAFDFGSDRRSGPPVVRDVFSYLPTAEDAAAGRRLVALLREADGDVIVPYHGYLARMAGKRGGAHAMALADVRGVRSRDLMKPLRQQFLDSARDRHAALVVLDGLSGIDSAEDLAGLWQQIASGGDREAVIAALRRIVGDGDLLRLVLPGFVPAGQLLPAGDKTTFVPRVGLPSRPLLLFRRER